MNRPRGPLDPETLARLQQILDPRRGAPARAVRRPEGPPAARIEIAYGLSVAPRETRPVVDVRQRRVEPNERPGKWEDARVTAKSAARVENETDREILVALLDASTTTASNQLAIAEEPTSRFVLSRAACARILPLLGKSGRLWLARPPAAGAQATAHPPGSAEGNRPLSWQERPWSLRLRVTEAPPGPAGGEVSWDVHGVLRSGRTEVALADVDAYLEGGYAVSRGCLARVDDGGASSWLGMLLTHRSVRITPARRASFLEELYSLPSAPPLDLPGSLALPEVAATAGPRLRVLAPGIDAGPLFADLSFGYAALDDPPGAPPFVVPSRRAGKVAFDAGRMRLVRRDAEAEASAAARLAELGVAPPPRGATVPEGTHLAISPARLPVIVAALVAEGWHVEAEGRIHRGSGGFQLGIRSGVDWLDLEGAVAFGGFTAPLPAVLEALRNGVSTVVLGDGSLGVLPEAWLAKHGIVLRLGTAHEGRIRFSRSQAPLLAALAAADPEVRADDDFVRAQEALAGEPETAPEDPPPGFQGELRAYQRAGLAWLRGLSRAGIGGLLADEMGLGKTVQVLSLLAGGAGGEARRPSLVVAPRSLVFNWKREAAKFTPGLRLLDHTGGERLPPGPHFRDHDLVLTTYGTLRRDAPALATIDFDYLILDEAQAIKNDTSETARAARQLRGARKVALTGTPVENHLGELWSIVEFLNPGLLGRAAAWRAAADASASPDAVALLGRALRPMLLRRTKVEVAPDLPARMEETWVCELDPPDRAVYEELRARFRAELLGRAEGAASVTMGETPKPPAQPARVLEALLRLRQAACHPGLLDPARRGGRGAKLDALIPELVSLRESGQKALVFSQFRSLLDLCRPHLEAEGLGVLQLDGTTRDREAMVARFQSDPSCNVFLISLKAGGVGLNLTAAEYVFLLDPWWNPAAEAQAIDRAHRIGQTRAVFAYRLIAKDTVEERIAELQQRKRLLAESVIRGDGAPLRDLSPDDLDRLLS